MVLVMFTIDESNELGVGKFGTVFAGVFNETPVAVKKIKPHSLLLNKGAYEAHIQAQLVHPNIVRLLSSFEQHKVVYLVMELMALGDLFDILYIKNNTLDLAMHHAIIKDVVAGLDYLHDKGFLHRDIKPENILFNDRMQAKIGDFGLAIKQSDSKTSTFVGTKNYLAPELALSYMQRTKKYEYTKLTDIYALGLTLLEMVLRTKAYGKSDEDLSWSDIATSKYLPTPLDIDPICANVIASCLTNNPAYRIGTKFLNQLLAILLPELGGSVPIAIDGEYHIIHEAAKNGYPDIVKRLVACNRAFINLKDSCNQTALLWAASRGHEDIV